MATILIIDDNPEDQEKLSGILTQEGYSTKLASVGPEGLSACDTGKPDLITLDLVMPEMNGIETLRLLKQRFPEIPVVMCSAAGLEQVVDLALRVGAAGYIVKPYTRDMVLSMVRDHLKQ
jgi:CheY-like chemotaxis protein